VDVKKPLFYNQYQQPEQYRQITAQQGRKLIPYLKHSLIPSLIEEFDLNIPIEKLKSDPSIWPDDIASGLFEGVR